MDGPGLGRLMHERLLATRLFNVERRVFPQGGRGPIIREVVVHPGAVVILPILADRRLVMIRNYRYSVGRELWELPAGTREPDETPLGTAHRELIEETGYRAAEMNPMMEFHTSPGILTERMHAFVATDLTTVGQDLEPNERITVEAVSFDEARRKIVAGEYVDGKTIAVLATFFLQSVQ